jgi:hypothetical protein
VRGSQFQARLAASCRPVLLVRASQDGLGAPKPMPLMPVSVALSPGRLNGAFRPARLPGGQLAIAGMGAVDTGGGACQPHHVGVAGLLMPVMPGVLDRAGQLHVADPADLVGHVAGQTGAGGLAHRAVRAVRAGQVPRGVPGPARLDARLIGGLPGPGHLGAMAHPAPVRVRGGRVPGAPLRERQREPERRVRAAVAGQVGQPGAVRVPGPASPAPAAHR